MAKVFIEETTLTAIGDAIRGKEGTTELVPVTDMATRITDLPSGGGGNEPTAEELTVTGNCDYRFANNGWNWVIDKYGNQITTKDITGLNSMFMSSAQIKNIPFVLNVKNIYSFMNVFQGCNELSEAPKIRGTIRYLSSTSFDAIFNGCFKLRDVEETFTPEMLDEFSKITGITSAYSVPRPVIFSQCRSLRQIPSWWYKFKWNPAWSVMPYYSYAIYFNCFKSCYPLDEAKNIPVWYATASPVTSNMFSETFSECYRLKNVTFETNEDGSPIIANWKSQTIDLSIAGFCGGSVGYRQYIINYNSGITQDKEVSAETIYNDPEIYNKLKNDPDWYAIQAKYSRYNKISAIETINSLPDTSAYLASAGGTNTIKFKGSAGSATDGGAINTLTEEEIAVATAKGWTVTLVS